VKEFIEHIEKIIEDLNLSDENELIYEKNFAELCQVILLF
jgi:hypothetical protein